MTATNWRDSLKIHPAAELFPQMTPDELMKLGGDIKVNGMRVPINSAAHPKRRFSSRWTQSPRRARSRRLRR
jgi:hypothetical protein